MKIIMETVWNHNAPSGSSIQVSEISRVKNVKLSRWYDVWHCTRCVSPEGWDVYSEVINEES